MRLKEKSSVVPEPSRWHTYDVCDRFSNASRRPEHKQSNSNFRCDDVSPFRVINSMNNIMEI